MKDEKDPTNNYSPNVQVDCFFLTDQDGNVFEFGSNVLLALGVEKLEWSPISFNEKRAPWLFRVHGPN